MNDNVRDLKHHWDKYLYKVKISYTSLFKVDNALLPLKLVGSLSDQVARLVKTAVMKDGALLIIWG